MGREQDILQELNELQSPLAKFPKTMPYRVPDAYFDGLTKQITSVVLADVPLTKDMPYDVPGGYFDTLPKQILQSVKSDDTVDIKKQTKSKRIWMNVRWAAAAMLILSISIGSYSILNPQTISIQQQLGEIPEAAILAYVQDNIDEFDTEYIINNLDNTNAIQAQADNLNDETIEYYLENSGWQ